jgi:hypothetical protein
MDQRFSIFFLEKYRLKLQQGRRSSYEDEIGSEGVIRPNKLRQLLSQVVAWATTSSKVLKEKDSSLIDHKRINHQTYID